MNINYKAPLVNLLILCAMLWASASAMASGQALDISGTSDPAVALAPYIAVLEDPGQKLTLDDVRQPAMASQFDGIATDQALNVGFTRSAYWLRLTLRNASSVPVARLIDIGQSTLSNIQFFHPQADGSQRTVSTGAAWPFSTRAYRDRFFVFPVTLPSHTSQTFYFRVQSANGMLIPATLWEPQAFQVHQRNSYAIQAAYVGIATALVLYNLLLFFTLRDVVHLLYAIFATTMALAVSAANGFGMEFLWPEAPYWSNSSLNVLYSLAFAAQVVFIRHMLDMKAIAPRVDLFFKVLIAAMLVFPIGLFISLETFAAPVSIVQAIAGIALLVILLYCAHFKDQRLAALVAIAFSMLLLGGLVVELKALTLIPHNSFTDQGLQIGSALEMLLLAFALAYRFGLIRLQATDDIEKAHLGLAARLQARELELTEIHQRLREGEHFQTLSQERQRLMQDMHDGMGSSLTTALRVVEGGSLDKAAVAAVLKGCIDDLKLAIDSMEPADADLLLVLATLRFRLGPRLEASGIRLKWEVEQVPALKWLEPKLSLHILRILQEAFTNVIKHANATDISVATKVQGDKVAVTVSDNGRGYVVQHHMEGVGRGLANQRSRAQALGAEVRWESSIRGTCLTLLLPVNRLEP